MAHLFRAAVAAFTLILGAAIAVSDREDSSSHAATLVAREISIVIAEAEDEVPSTSFENDYRNTLYSNGTMFSADNVVSRAFEFSVPDGDFVADFEPYRCEAAEEILVEAYNGLASHVPVYALPYDYFEDVQEHAGWPFFPKALWSHGEIRIWTHDCNRIENGPVPLNPDWQEKYDLAFNVVWHEAAHAVDEMLGWISLGMDFPVTDIGHAQTSRFPNKELFAFCLQATAGQDIRDRCPQENHEVMKNVYKLLGITHP